ncbi:MAG: tyrosine--tRNA ligase [Oscillospiraceae bacterium]|jgi:tyrosyl-tRNA synthetase|nr:tyrosine--tRNA ligase [Oscillospiraceae bacterium]
MTLYEELRARGLIAQTTGEDEVAELINNGKATFYIGYDPTADSLTAGHYMTLCLMKRLQMAGNRPVALAGGGTGMVGDPSGRQDLRKIMTVETVDYNVAKIKEQISRFIEFGEGKGLLVNNADWLRGLNYLEFLRDFGVHFSVNRMLTADCYRNRMEKGLTFLEFNYMIMQAYDFYELFLRCGCNMQCGGDDQWSNMLAGTELIRRKLQKDAHVLTITLLTDSNGVKMGKTAGNALWLDANRTSPYEFFQYWRNVDDASVVKCLKMLTFLPVEQIAEMEAWRDKKLNEAKEILAYEVTKQIHGEDAAAAARDTARALFTSGGAADMPETALTEADFTDGMIDILALLQKSGLVPSRSDARRAVMQGGVEADGEKITDIAKKYTPDELCGAGLILRRGKKSFRRVTLCG